MLLQYLRQVFCFDGLGYCVNWNLERLCCLKQVYLRRILKEVVTVKALFFLNSFAGGGAERVCLNLAKELYRLNIESDFVTVYAGKTDYDVPRYIRVYCIGAREGVHALGILWKIIRSVSGVNTFIDGQEYLLITPLVTTSVHSSKPSSIPSPASYFFAPLQNPRLPFV